ncbi:hypothetical protein BDZ45DRAFT_739456 [Acephala macrosclerotiorum]|nr:hypothetical protein BDZ45DRAFT_739456 [Acephala macrosclerotiorum]
MPVRDLLEQAETREEALAAEVRSLQSRLSLAQRSEWHLQNLRIEHQKVVNEHYGCRHLQQQLEANVREVRRLESTLAKEEDINDKLVHKNEKLEEKVRLMKRGSRESDGLREAYEQKELEVEVLRQRLMERDETLRLAEVRIAEKNSRIVYLKEFLWTKGYRVE